MTMKLNRALGIVVVGVADRVVMTPDAGAAELNLAIAALDGADEMVNGREVATIAVDMYAVVAVVRGC